MTREEVNKTIVRYLAPYDPRMVGIFGSYARGEDGPDSDIDILIDLRKRISLLDLVRFHRELRELIGKKIDIVTLGALKNERLKKYIFEDLQYLVNEA